MTTYTYKAVEDLKNRYLDLNGSFLTKDWGLLDNYLFFWEGLKYTVCLEVYLNERSSAYTIRHFKKLPKKYSDFFEFELF